VPRILKVVLNVGMGEAARTPKMLDAVVDELGVITGQKATIRRSKKAIANFNLRAGLPVGATVTLRDARMYEFLDRFINIAVPPDSATSAGCRTRASMDGGTTPSVSRSR
jgi:large subunit ribosomal protein L5